MTFGVPKSVLKLDMLIDEFYQSKDVSIYLVTVANVTWNVNSFILEDTA